MRQHAWLILMMALPMTGQIAPPNDSGVSMGHLYIVSPDVAAHRKAWVEAMGGQYIRAEDVELVKFPGVIVVLREGNSEGGSAGTVVDHLGFSVREGQKLREKFRVAGIPIIREMPETKQFFANFPGDVRVEFTEDPALPVPIAHHHVHFATHQLEQMREWYGQALGAQLGMRGRFPAADIPGANLSWNRAEKPTLPTHGRTLEGIGFEVQDLDATSRKLESAGARLERRPDLHNSLRIRHAVLTDPWGTRIHLTQGLAAF
jgi:catechol 2,3-dioxygenase-like lactoylglutathione lyase family enzyme